MEPRKTETATDTVETEDQEMKSTDDNIGSAVPEEMGSSSDQVGLSFEEGRLRKDDGTWMSTALDKFRLELLEKERQLKADLAEKERQLKADQAEKERQLKADMAENETKLEADLAAKERQLKSDLAERDGVMEEIRFAVEQLRLTNEQDNLKLKADQDRELEEIQLELKSLKSRIGNSETPGQ